MKWPYHLKSSRRNSFIEIEVEMCSISCINTASEIIAIHFSKGFKLKQSKKKCLKVTWKITWIRNIFE